MRNVAKQAWSLIACFAACGAAHAQLAAPTTPLDCQKSIRAKRFDAPSGGPTAQFVGYSKALKTCVVVVRQERPANDPKQISMSTSILDAQTRSPLWSHSGLVAFNGKMIPQDPALGAGLKQLQADVLPALK